MAEKSQQIIQKEMSEVVSDIDRMHLRKMQRTMHLCAAKCCESNTTNIEETHKCVENCSNVLNQAQAYIHSELNQFQERLQRCVFSCQDNVKDKLTSDTNEAQVNLYKAEFESCALTCVDDHVKLLPGYKKRIADTFAKYQ